VTNINERTLRSQIKSESEAFLNLLMYREIDINELIEAIKECPNQPAHILWLRYNRILNLKRSEPGYSGYFRIFQIFGNIKAG